MWTKRFYIVLSLIPLLVGFVGFITLLQSPYHGIDFESKDDRWYIASVSPDGPAGRFSEIAGREIISISGWGLKPEDLSKDPDYIADREDYLSFWEAQYYFSTHILEGVPTVISIRDSSKTYDVNITPSYFPVAKAIFRISITFLATLFFLLVGLLIVIKKPKDIRARVFFFYGLLLSLSFFTVGTYTSRDIVFSLKTFKGFEIISILSAYYAVSALLHFCLIFPHEKGIIHYRPFILSLYLLFPPLFTVIALLRISFALQWLFPSLSFLIGIASLSHSFFTLKSPAVRSQIKWVIGGATLSLAISMLFMFFIPLFFTGHTLLNVASLSILTSIVFLSMAFAIIKYRLMDIDTLFDNTIIYILTLSTLAMVDMGVISTFANIKGEVFRVDEPVASIIAIWLVIFAYIPVRNSIKRGVKILLKRELYDLNNVSLKLSSELISALNLSSVFEKAGRMIEETLHPKGGIACLYNKEGGIDKKLPFIGNEVAIPKITPQHLKNIKGAAPLYNLNLHEGLPVDYAGGVMVTLAGPVASVGCFILKGKHSGRLYSSEDLRLLNTVANQTALAIDNIYHREEALKKEREAREARDRIVKDMHDGLGNILTNITVASQAVEQLFDADRDRAKDTIYNISEYSREAMEFMRTGLSVLDNPDGEIGIIISAIRHRFGDLLTAYGLNVKFEITEDAGRLKLDAKANLNIIRCIQESLTNVIKHSKAKNVSVRFFKEGDTLKILVEDDGRGSDLAPHLASPQRGEGWVRGTGYGLKNIFKRMEEIGGSAEIKTAAGAGTKLMLSIPIPIKYPDMGMEML